jgi:Zn-dependent alcohol dehydrogenase
LGAHYGFTEHAAGLEFIREHTRGVMADKVIQCVNVLDAATTRACFDATRKGGTLVLTGLSDEMSEITVELPGGILSMYAKRVLGSLYGGCNPRNDIPRLLGLYRAGHLKLDELITHRYELAEVDQGYQDLAEGKLIRGLVTINPH